MSEALLLIARFLHYTSTIVLSGGLCFAVLIVPARSRGGPWRRSAWAALSIVVLSGALWFVSEAARMSASPIAEALRPRLLATVLWHTQFGPVFAVRLALCALLAAVLLLRTPAVRWIPLALSALLLASLAWVGHAVGEVGADHLIHVAADSLHLLAAGAWLGGLPMLALLLHRALVRATPEAHETARRATRRFSVMGLVAVATLLATGIVNTVFLSGSPSALIGTDYGRWLLVKIVLFAAMVAIAAVNRRVLTPQLESREPARLALLGLRRNALLEAALGVMVVAIVAWLGTAVPGSHQQAAWPFSVRYNGAAFSLPEYRRGLWLAIAAVVAALGLALAAIMLRRWIIGSIIVALALVAFALPRFSVLVTTAYPTSFFNSTTGYTAHSVAVGARAFARNCAVCHGEDGKGDGPLARSLPIPPADLTEDHIYGHLPGELYWMIGHGIPGTPMPRFADKLDIQTRWNLIDFILANADGVRAKAGTPAQVPDFAIECPGGVDTSLRASTGHLVVLVFGGSGAAARVAALARLGLGADVTLVAATEAVSSAGICVARADDLATALALYLPGGAQRIAESEFLIDAHGWLRDAWPSAPDVATLRRALTIARTEPVTASPRPTGHVH